MKFEVAFILYLVFIIFIIFYPFKTSEYEIMCFSGGTKFYEGLGKDLRFTVNGALVFEDVNKTEVRISGDCISSK